MRLKKIVLSGFKSFADKTTLEFPQGITAIVGPNGCGKSNVCDAFRWVLGEKSAKSLRGKHMADVIFMGNDKRKPLGYAEVSIAFIDVGGHLPVEYDEVTITRRVYPDGESEYLINRHAVRLKDIQNLLMGSGMGKNAYAIFEQGEMDKIIQYSPEERRTIFEELAGISGFLQRKREAFGKLDRTEQNLNRVRDIFHEVKKQVALLERQAEKAKKYAEKKERLIYLEKVALLMRWQRANEIWLRCKQAADKTINQAMAVRSQIEREKAEHQVLLVAFEDAQREYYNHRSSLISLRSSSDLKKQLKENLIEKQRESTERSQFLESSQEELREKQQQYKKEADQKNAVAAESERVLIEKEQALHKERKDTLLLEQEVSRLREEQLLAERERLEIAGKKGGVESELKKNGFRVEYLAERKEKILERQVQFDPNTEGEVIALEGQVQVVSKSVDEMRVSLENLKKQQQDLEQELETIRSEKERRQQSISESTARLHALKRLKEEMQGFSEDSKRILLEGNDQNSSLFGKVGALFEVMDVAKKSLGMMRAYSQTLTVSSIEDFRLVVEFAKQHKLKNFSLFNLCNRDSKSLREHFFGSLSSASSIEQAIAYESTEYIVGEETYIDHRNVVFFFSNKESNAFARETEIKLLEKEKRDKQQKLTEVREKQQSIERQIEHFKTVTFDADQRVRREEMKLIEVNFCLQQKKEELERHQRELEQLNSELQENEKTSQSLLNERKELEQQIKVFDRVLGEKKQHSLDSQVQYEDKLVLLKEKEAQLKENEQAYQSELEQFQKLTYELNLLEVREKECEQQIIRMGEERDACEERKEQIVENLNVCEQEQIDIERQLQELNEETEKIEEALELKKTALKKSEEGFEQLREDEKALNQKRMPEEVEMCKQTSIKEQAEQELIEYHEMTIESLIESELSEDRPLTELEEEMRKLRRQIDSMGAVNMTAIEEKEESQERLEQLATQMEDLEKSKQELIQIIQQLDSESRALFLEIFEKVRENFRRNYEILFNGGEADLHLIGASDALEAGVEVIARPPGKKMQTLGLLSGGEKCLTAIALLFAVFEVKPAPFCILDEMDAPLDDTNIDRFVRVLQKFNDQCQFIMITHNKRTMAIADLIFGVSMPEKGISKVISLEFSKDGAPEPTLV